MTGEVIERAQPAHEYPLLIGSLLRSGLTRAPEQDIVYADKARMSYREFGERVHRLASGLSRLALGRGTRWR
jgi:acyl-CoA synthetase (AMP-forming)/AMP-acid ligase II